MGNDGEGQPRESRRRDDGQIAEQHGESGHGEGGHGEKDHRHEGQRTEDHGHKGPYNKRQRRDGKEERGRGDDEDRSER